MSLFARTNEKSSREEDYPPQIGMGTVTAARYGGGGMGVGNSMPVSPKSQVEMDKRMRREVANSNERRRMQSINAGFQSLRNLLPRHENEKLSKAAILQHTAEYIYQLEQEKTRLLSQNCQLKRVIHNQQLDGPESPRPPKRKKQELDAAVCPESDEGFGNMSPEQQEDQSNEELRKEMIDLRVQLDRERRLRMMMEDQTRSLRQQIYPEPRREISSRMTYQSGYGADAYLKADILDEAPPPPRRRPQMMDKQTDPLDVEPLVKSEELTEDMACLAGTQGKLFSLLSHGHKVTLEEAAATLQTRDILSDRIPVMIETSMEPKVEVEVAPRVPSPAAHTAITADGQTITQATKSSRIYVAKTSRQNLETIVEAIRHLEGDHLFSDDKVKREPSPLHDDDHIQEVPLELTTSVRSSSDVVPLTSSSTFPHPGVIVFKNAPSSL